MDIFFGILIVSFALHALLYIPYINLLYKIKFQRKAQKTKDALGKFTPIFDHFHHMKAGVPVGGGLLIILTTLVLYGIVFILFKFFWYETHSVYPIQDEIKIIIFTFLSFAVVGLYDDVKKTFQFNDEDFFGLRLRHKLILEIVLAGLVSYWMFDLLKISIIHIPLLGVFTIGWWFVPFAIFVILAFANGFNITDGLDGLSCGVLMIALTAFWVLSASILDTPMSVFIAIWVGGLIAFLYFNVYPARIILGDVGALAFGATFAVIGLLLGKTFALVIIGGIFVVEVFTSFVQLLSKKYVGKKIFKAAPLHLLLQSMGWEEPKIVMRFWLAGIVLAIVGLWLSFIH